MAIKVTIGNNMNSRQVIVDPNSTVRQVLEDNEVNYGVGLNYLGGMPLSVNDLDKTFTEFGVRDSVALTNIVKHDGGC